MPGDYEKQVAEPAFFMPLVRQVATKMRSSSALVVRSLLVNFLRTIVRTIHPSGAEIKRRLGGDRTPVNSFLMVVF
jgi:hypothetical protein